MPFQVPDACTLPTVEQPLRLAEFRDLFASAVRGVESVTDTRLRLYLTGPTGTEATVRDLAAREAQCCSFFAFTVTPVPGVDGDAVILDIEVPDQHVNVLQALADHARTAAPTP